MEPLAYLIVAALVLYFLVFPFLRGLRGDDKKTSGGRRKRHGEHVGDDAFLFRCAVHGESFYQNNIRRVAVVGKAVDLVPEPKNPHDKNAVRIDVDGLTIGYIPRETAAEAKHGKWKAIIADVYSGQKATGVVLGITETSRQQL